MLLLLLISSLVAAASCWVVVPMNTPWFNRWSHTWSPPPNADGEESWADYAADPANNVFIVGTVAPPYMRNAAPEPPGPPALHPNGLVKPPDHLPRLDRNGPLPPGMFLTIPPAPPRPSIGGGIWEWESSTEGHNMNMMSCQDRNVIIRPVSPLQECDEAIDSLRNCVTHEDYELREITKWPEFRADVMCNYLDSPEFHSAVRAEIGTEEELLEEYFNSTEFKNIINDHARLRLDEDLWMEAKDEVEREVGNRVGKIKTWLKSMEKKFLLEMLSMLSSAMSEPTPSLPPTEHLASTTYLTLPTTDMEFSHPLAGFAQESRSYMFSTSPPGWQTTEYAKGPHLCSPGNWAMDLVVRSKRIFITHGENQINVLNKDRTTDGAILFRIYPCNRTQKSYQKVYKGVRLRVDLKRRLLFTYKEYEFYGTSDQSDREADFPALGDTPHRRQSYIYFYQKGTSTFREADCTNTLPGEGLYRKLENGTCIGMPLFSKNAARVSQECTEDLLPGINLRGIQVRMINDQAEMEDCMKKAGRGYTELFTTVDLATPTQTPPLPPAPQRPGPVPFRNEPLK